MTYNEKQVLRYMMYNYLGYELVNKKFGSFESIIFRVKEFLKIENIEFNEKQEKKYFENYVDMTIEICWYTIIFEFLGQKIAMDIYYKKDDDGIIIIVEIDINFLKEGQNNG